MMKAPPDRGVQLIMEAVTEFQPGNLVAKFAHQTHTTLKRNLSKSYDNSNLGQKLPFPPEKGTAVIQLGCRGAVAGRSTTTHCRNEGISQNQAVIGMARDGLIGEAGFVQGAVQGITRAIAGEHSAGAIGPMRARRKAHNEERGGQVAKAGYWLAPIIPIAVGPSLFSRHLLAPFHQTRASTTCNNLGVQFLPG